jgi:hypothetical protein
LDLTQSSGISSIERSISDEKSSNQQMTKPEINITSNVDNQRLTDQQILNLPKTPICSLNILTGSLAEPQNRFSQMCSKEDNPIGSQNTHSIDTIHTIGSPSKEILFK